MSTQVSTISELQAARRLRAQEGLDSGKYRVEWIEPGESALVLRPVEADEMEVSFIEDGFVVRHVNRVYNLCPCADQVNRRKLGLRCKHIQMCDLEEERFERMMEDYFQSREVARV